MTFLFPTESELLLPVFKQRELGALSYSLLNWVAFKVG